MDENVVHESTKQGLAKSYTLIARVSSATSVSEMTLAQPFIAEERPFWGKTRMVGRPDVLQRIEHQIKQLNALTFDAQELVGDQGRQQAEEEEDAYLIGQEMLAIAEAKRVSRALCDSLRREDIAIRPILDSITSDRSCPIEPFYKGVDLKEYLSVLSSYTDKCRAVSVMAWASTDPSALPPEATVEWNHMLDELSDLRAHVLRLRNVQRTQIMREDLKDRYRRCRLWIKCSDSYIVMLETVAGLIRPFLTPRKRRWSQGHQVVVLTDRELRCLERARARVEEIIPDLRDLSQPLAGDVSLDV